MAYSLKLNVDGVKKTAQEVIDRALMKVGDIAEGYAIDLCPVKTSTLSNSITHVPAGPGRVAIGTNVEYAPFVELGHHQEVGRYVPAIGKRLVNDWVEPKAFLRPALENHVSEYESILKRELAKG